MATRVAVADNSDMLMKMGTTLFNTIVKEAGAASPDLGGAAKPVDLASKNLTTDVAVKGLENTIIGQYGQLDNNFRLPRKANENLDSTGYSANDAAPARPALADISNDAPSKYGISDLMSMRHKARISEDKVTTVRDFNHELENSKQYLPAYHFGREAVFKQHFDKEAIFQGKPAAAASLPQSENNVGEQSIAIGRVVANPVEPVVKKTTKVPPKVSAEIPKLLVKTAATYSTNCESKPNPYARSSMTTHAANGGDKCQVCGAFDHQVNDCFWAKKRR